MPYGITQCYLPPGRGNIPAFTPPQSCPWVGLTHELGWVGLGQSVRWVGLDRFTQNGPMDNSVPLKAGTRFSATGGMQGWVDLGTAAKAAYRIGCRDKHNRPRRDSNLGPFTPQSDALTTRLLRPDLLSCGVIFMDTRVKVYRKQRLRVRCDFTISLTLNVFFVTPFVTCFTNMFTSDDSS